MKKIVVSIVSVCMFAPLFGQTSSGGGGGVGIEAGFRGAAASNWLFNTNVSNSPNESYAAAFSYNYGLDAALDFNEHVAIEANLLFATMSQGYSGKFGANESIPEDSTEILASGESYTAHTQISAMSIPVLFRFGSGNGAYIEIGPEYQIIQKASYSVTYSNGYPIIGVRNYSNVDVTKAFAGSNILGVLGFGDDFQLGSSGLNIITNLRFYYGFTDLVGVDAHGEDIHTTLNGKPNDALYKNPYQPNNNGPYYASYKATHLAGASFSLGLYYYFGVTKNNGGRKACKHAPTVKD